MSGAAMHLAPAAGKRGFRSMGFGKGEGRETGFFLNSSTHPVGEGTPPRGALHKGGGTPIGKTPCEKYIFHQYLHFHMMGFVQKREAQRKPLKTLIFPKILAI